MKSLQSHPLRALINDSSLPSAIRELVQLSAIPMIPVERSAAVLERDPVGRRELFRLTNSVTMAPRADVRDVKLAIPMIGERKVRPLLWSSLYRQIEEELEDLAVDAEAWLEHLPATVSMATRLHDRLFPKGLIEETELEMAVWLSDIGKLVLLFHADLDYERVLGRARVTEQPLCQIEAELLGLTHAEVGAELLASEGHSPRLIACLRHRYTPHESPIQHLPYVAMLHLADVLTWRQSGGDGFGGIAPPFEPRLFERLGIQGESLDRLLMKLTR
ncbi:MAG: HDOD domain-containing protein [Planctomycetota bacterium]